MSKERLEESIRAVKSNWPDEKYSLLRDALDYIISEAERVQELEMEIEQDPRQGMLEDLYAENKRYRELLESIRYTQDIAQEIQAENPSVKVITPDDLLQHMLRKVNKELESESE